MAELLKATGIYYRNELRSIHKNGVKLQPVYEAFTNSWESILEKYTAEHLNLGSIVIEFHYNGGIFEEDKENNLLRYSNLVLKWRIRFATSHCLDSNCGFQSHKYWCQFCDF